MTAEQFNLKYAIYLEPGHYGCALINEKQIDYLDEMFEEFIQVPGFTYSQIKSKFGGYRVYTSNVISSETCYEVERHLKVIELEINNV